MISLKKDYERNVKLINDQMLLYQQNKLHIIQTCLPTASQHCEGLSSICVHFLLSLLFHVIVLFLNMGVLLSEMQ